MQAHGLDRFRPDLNESYLKFSVNQRRCSSFWNGSIKGVGASAVRAIIKERKENGNYNSIFDLAKRVDLRAANKKAFDSLVKLAALTRLKTPTEHNILVKMKKELPF